MGERITGYTLLVIGFSVMIASLYLVFNVFSGASEPYALFDLHEISIDATLLIPAESLNPDVDHNIVLMDKDSLNHVANTIFYLIFMGFAASIGFKIASIGTMLVRTIQVNLKEAKEKKPQSNAVTTKK
jgi:hypothetical protein